MAEVSSRDRRQLVGIGGAGSTSAAGCVGERSGVAFSTGRSSSFDGFFGSGRTFFRAEIEVASAELEKVRGVLGRGQLRPGLPVEVVLAIRKRTRFNLCWSR
jgi:hypothetical protein